MTGVLISSRVGVEQMQTKTSGGRLFGTREYKFIRDWDSREKNPEIKGSLS